MLLKEWVVQDLVNGEPPLWVNLQQVLDQILRLRREMVRECVCGQEDVIHGFRDVVALQ